MFLPGTPNPIPHVVTSHTTANNETHPTKPFSNHALLHLYKGNNTNILLQQYATAWKTQSKYILSKLKSGFARCLQWV